MKRREELFMRFYLCAGIRPLRLIPLRILLVVLVLCSNAAPFFGIDPEAVNTVPFRASNALSCINFLVARCPALVASFTIDITAVLAVIKLGVEIFVLESHALVEVIFHAEVRISVEAAAVTQRVILGKLFAPARLVFFWRPAEQAVDALNNARGFCSALVKFFLVVNWVAYLERCGLAAVLTGQRKGPVAVDAAVHVIADALVRASFDSGGNPAAAFELFPLNAFLAAGFVAAVLAFLHFDGLAVFALVKNTFEAHVAGAADFQEGNKVRGVKRTKVLRIKRIAEHKGWLDVLGAELRNDRSLCCVFRAVFKPQNQRAGEG